MKWYRSSLQHYWLSNRYHLEWYQLYHSLNLIHHLLSQYLSLIHLIEYNSSSSFKGKMHQWSQNRYGFSYISFHSFLGFLQSTLVDSRLYCICLYLVLSSCILIPHGLIQSDQRNGNMMFLTLCPSSSPFLTPIRMISPFCLLSYQ